MKKNILVILFFTFYYSFGQMITHDTNLNLAMIKSNILNSKAVKSEAIANREKLSKAGALLNSSKKSYDKLSKMKEYYDKVESSVSVVNDKILTGREIYDIIDTFQNIERTYNQANQIFTKDDAVLYEDRLAMIKMFGLIFLETLDSMERSKDITRTGTYKMNDNERLKYIIDIKGEMKKKLNVMRYIMNKYMRARRLALNDQYGERILEESVKILKD